MKPLISLLLTLVFAVTLFAQKEDVTVETDLPPTLVRAEKLPLPDYPEAAKNAGLRGSVSVDVTLDEEGKVLHAENARGPYPVCQSVTDPAVMELRNSALAAAKEARFQGVDGQAIPGKGRITYNFGSEVEAGASVEPRIEPSDVGARVTDSGQAVVKGNTDNKEIRLDRLTIIGSTKVGRVSDANETVTKGSMDNKEERLDRVTRPASDDVGARVIAPGEPYPEKGADTPMRPKIVSGGVLNGKAAELPKPSYPPAAKAVRASGSVAVQVLTSQDGSVYSSRAVSGHPLLRSASEIAACNARFWPTLLQGHPVKVSGVITYNYVP